MRRTLPLGMLPLGILPLLIAAAAGLSSSGCASAGAVPRPFPVPDSSTSSTSPREDSTIETGEPAATVPRSPATPEKPASPESDLASTGATRPDGYAIAGTALALRGAAYRNGGSDPSGFDCSGFVHYVFAQHGINVGRAVRDQFAAGQDVPFDAIEPGDLLFFTTTAPGVSHVGISIGGNQFVHAPSTRGTVRVEALSSSYWGPRYLGARRLDP